MQVKTWKEINRPLFLALRLEKIVMFATISLIIFVAALNLISSLVDADPGEAAAGRRPAHPRRDREERSCSIFLQVGLLIGLTGTLLGNIFGLGLAWAANRYHLIPLPRDIYFISYLPFRLDASDVFGVNVIADRCSRSSPPGIRRGRLAARSDQRDPGGMMRRGSRRRSSRAARRLRPTVRATADADFNDGGDRVSIGRGRRLLVAEEPRERQPASMPLREALIVGPRRVGPPLPERRAGARARHLRPQARRARRASSIQR